MSGSSYPYSSGTPDFNSEIYADTRQRFIDAGLTRDQAIALMADSWNACIKANKTAEAATTNKIEFLPINQSLRLPDQPPRIPSAAVMATLRKGDYVPLYHFTNEALDAVKETTELGLMLDDKSTLLPSNVRKADEELDMHEFFEATTHMLELLAYAGWPEDRIRMFRDFWANIRCHRLWHSLEPEVDRKALLMYQGEQRRRWHMLCASTSNSAVIYNLAIINEKVLEQTRSRIDALRVAEARRIADARELERQQALQRNMNHSGYAQNQKRRRR